MDGPAGDARLGPDVDRVAAMPVARDRRITRAEAAGSGRVGLAPGDGAPARPHLPVARPREGHARGDAVRDRVLAIVSHDFRLPLAAAALSLAALRRRIPASGPAHDALVSAEESVAWMRRLANDLRDYAAIRSGRLSVLPIPTNAAAVLESVTRLARPVVEASGLTLVVEPAPVEPVFVADHDRLVQVLLNLVANACAATEAGGWIRLTGGHEPGRSPPGDMHFVVQDSGGGMPRGRRGPAAAGAGIAARRPPPAGCIGTGAGLGLAIVRGIMRAHGGTVRITSAPGRGTRVRLALPVVSPAPD